MTNINNNKEIIANNVSFGNVSKDNKNDLEKLLLGLKNGMLKRELEIPDYGNFSKVKEIIQNGDEKIYAGNMELVCEPSEDNPIKRYLNFNQYNPQNRKGLSCLVAVGTKEDIINKLNDENFINEMKKNSERMSEKMKKMKW